MKRIKMRSLITKALCISACATAVLPSDAEATHGYFLPGYGVRSSGMGGTAVANPQDSLVVATNPAGLSFIEDRMDYGFTVFNPVRSYSHTLPTPDHVNSHRDLFLMPAISGVRHSECNSYGLAMYGRGGMNTTYPRDNVIFGNGEVAQNMGLDYMQMLITPSYSRALSECQSIGISLVYGIQRIRIRGLQGFAGFSSDPDNLTNHGYSYAQGIGARVGWMGDVGWNLKVGVSYGTKVYMSRFKKYKGIIAERGKIDIPADFNAGLMWQPSDCLQVAFDYQRIFYHGVKSVGHGISSIGPGNLGSGNGAGFGWNDINVYKVGVNYFAFQNWEFRAGYSYGSIPYPSSQIDFNILAPAVTKHHASIGTTYHIGCNHQLDFFYMYAFHADRKGVSNFGLGDVHHKMYQNAFGFNFAYLY